MRNYTITVNGNVYDVTVDGGEGGAAPVVSNVKAEAPKAVNPRMRKAPKQEAKPQVEEPQVEAAEAAETTEA